LLDGASTELFFIIPSLGETLCLLSSLDCYIFILRGLSSIFKLSSDSFFFAWICLYSLSSVILCCLSFSTSSSSCFKVFLRSKSSDSHCFLNSSCLRRSSSTCLLF
jgi:hypothetical protein